MLSGRHNSISLECCFEFLRDIEAVGFLEDEEECKTLINVAKMRLVLTLVCILIHKALQGDGNADKKSKTILGKCTQMIEIDPFKEHMQNFLVRNMAKMFSKDLVKDWTLSGMYRGIVKELNNCSSVNFQ